MPQLEISTYLTQIFWVITTFIIFWMVMDHVIIPKISDTIEARKRKYDDYIIKAEEINKKALATLERYESTLAAAKSKASEQIKANEDALKKMIDEREEEITQQLKSKMAEHEKKLETDKASTMAKIEDLSKIAAMAIVKELDLKSISEADINQALKKE